ncbi:unnamed protein product [Eruca vesicaria subsp. sativa]|uniref:Uncharacterized protein n=1 Tax=Eruca vesicaria subsp. sativa TaxID=29727 RepID=A0ABC8JM75_ERUVS|nr:unnamed protein product [Eruca vesicaria subsp. sativa]
MVLGNLLIFANRRLIMFDFVSHLIVNKFPEIPGGEKRSYPSTGSSLSFDSASASKDKKSANIVLSDEYESQIPLFFIQVICPHIALFDTVLVWRCGPFMVGDWLKWALVSVIQFVIGKRFYVAAWRALRNGSTNMDVLVALGTSASYFYSVGALLYGAVTGFLSPTYFEASAMLITFVLLGKYLESLAKGKTSDAMKKLVQLTPATAILIEGKGEREIDALLIHPVPVSKEVDSPVIGGTINMHSVLHIKATKVGSDAVLSQIISLVETAQMSKTPIQKFVDYVASIFVPVVITLALFTLVGLSIGGAVGTYPDEW